MVDLKSRSFGCAYPMIAVRSRGPKRAPLRMTHFRERGFAAYFAFQKGWGGFAAVGDESPTYQPSANTKLRG
jgi:hypothetical protein